jgi:DNA adenine methylase
MNNKQAKPFLKWAGGKRQLLKQFKLHFPKELNGKGHIKYYYEPFLGSGAVFFWVMQNCRIEKAYINEINLDVYLCYVAIKKDVGRVIKHLKKYEKKYLPLSLAQKKVFYLKIRDNYNKQRKKITFSKYNTLLSPKRASNTIFLNRTCFNGLYRVNSNGDFNVPFGTYDKPKICDEKNLLEVSRLLEKTHITNYDFEKTKKYLKSKSFVYVDPPYRPISKTSSFTTYSANTFNDTEQTRLARFMKEINCIKQVKIMISNSDPKNINPNDNFFENLYFDFNLRRVFANRAINCDGTKRGKINEVLITNY